MLASIYLYQSIFMKSLSQIEIQIVLVKRRKGDAVVCVCIFPGSEGRIQLRNKRQIKVYERMWK